jgi:hypothetical protein
MVKDFTLTLTGVAQRLSTVLADPTVGGKDDIPFRQIILCQDPANAAVIYVGSSSAITSTNFGFSLDPTEATAKDRESIGPFEAGPVKLSDLWVLGTNAQKLHVLGVPF